MRICKVRKGAKLSATVLKVVHLFWLYYHDTPATQQALQPTFYHILIWRYPKKLSKHLKQMKMDTNVEQAATASTPILDVFKILLIN